MKLKSAFTYNSLIIACFIALGYFTEVTEFYLVAFVFLMILTACSTKK